MTSSTTGNNINQINDRQIIEFIKDLENTAGHVEELLEIVHSSGLDFAALKTELRLLSENVKELSVILRDDKNGKSLIVRMELLEKRVTDLELQFKEKSDTIDEKNKAENEFENNIAVANKNGVWHMRAAIVVSIISLLATIITQIFAVHK